MGIDPPKFFLTNDAISERVRALAGRYSNIARLQQVALDDGRSIDALRIGTGPRSIVHIAGLHAGEIPNASLLLDWASDLLERSSTAPVRDALLGATIIVLPNVNPGGRAIVESGFRKGIPEELFWRGNAAGVDLNRNFPAYWDVKGGAGTEPGTPTYRGPRPASEPETRALTNFVGAVQPDVVTD